MTAPAVPTPVGMAMGAAAEPVGAVAEPILAEPEYVADEPERPAPRARPGLVDEAAAEARAFAGALRRAMTPWGIATSLLFAVLYARPAYLLVHDWWVNPEAGHGLLLAPLALWFAWKAGVVPNPRPNRAVGGALLVAGVAFRWLADLASELFVMRGSMLLALAGLAVWHFGVRQLWRWWLPFTLVALSIPLPEIVLTRIALPLQFVASKIGAGLLKWRDIDVLLTGNVIRIPGHELFVAEACSGLRSLTALISLGVLLGAIVLRHPLSRILLVLAVVPVAILLNGVRVFLTGFLVYFVDPALGEGFMHVTEGMLVFVVAFAILGGIAWLVGKVERRALGPEARPHDLFPPEMANG